MFQKRRCSPHSLLLAEEGFEDVEGFVFAFHNEDWETGRADDFGGMTAEEGDGEGVATLAADDEEVVVGGMGKFGEAGAGEVADIEAAFPLGFIAAVAVEEDFEGLAGRFDDVLAKGAGRECHGGADGIGDGDDVEGGEGGFAGGVEGGEGFGPIDGEGREVVEVGAGEDVAGGDLGGGIGGENENADGAFASEAFGEGAVFLVVCGDEEEVVFAGREFFEGGGNGVTGIEGERGGVVFEFGGDEFFEA